MVWKLCPTLQYSQQVARFHPGRRRKWRHFNLSMEPCKWLALWAHRVYIMSYPTYMQVPVPTGLVNLGYCMNSGNTKMKKLILGLIFITSTAIGSESTLTVESFYSKSLEGNPLGDSPAQYISIYLPPNYHTDDTGRFPVLYLLHGNTATISGNIHAPDVWISGRF